MDLDKALAESALIHLRKTTISYPEYVKRQQDPKYNWKSSNWGKAMTSLSQIVHPTGPLPAHSHDLAQSLLYATDDPFGALSAPAHYTVLVSADPAYRAWENDGWFKQARDQNRKIGIWCDCDATPAGVAIELKARYPFVTWSGQAESDAQAQNALWNNAPLLILNAATLSKPVRNGITARINAGMLSATQECYTNEGWPWPRDTSAIDIPVASFTIGLYAGRAGYVGVAAYEANGAQLGVSAYVSGVHPGELAQLP